jgi:hypothetical protein
VAAEVTGPSAEHARVALADAARASRSVATGEARWTVRYLTGFGLTIAILFPVVGLLPSPVGTSIFAPAWVAVVTVLVRYGRRQPVTRLGQGRLMVITFGCWAVAYAGALVIGEKLFAGNPAYWIPMALVVAAPFLAGAWLAGRR